MNGPNPDCNLVKRHDGQPGHHQHPEDGSYRLLPLTVVVVGQPLTHFNELLGHGNSVPSEAVSAGYHFRRPRGSAFWYCFTAHWW